MQNRNKMSFECCHLQEHEEEFKLLYYYILWKGIINRGRKSIFLSYCFPLVCFKRLYGENWHPHFNTNEINSTPVKTSIHILITERHTNKIKHLFILNCDYSRAVKFCSTPIKLIIGTQKAWKSKSAALQSKWQETSVINSNLLLQGTVSSDPWSKQEIYSTIILSEIMAQPSYGDLRDNQMSYSEP